MEGLVSWPIHAQVSARVCRRDSWVDALEVVDRHGTEEDHSLGPASPSAGAASANAGPDHASWLQAIRLHMATVVPMGSAFLWQEQGTCVLFKPGKEKHNFRLSPVG
jgi:hypothetical protein